MRAPVACVFSAKELFVGLNVIYLRPRACRSTIARAETAKLRLHFSALFCGDSFAFFAPAPSIGGLSAFDVCEKLSSYIQVRISSISYNVGF